PTVLAGMVAWPMDDAPEVLNLLRELAAEAPDELGVMANLRLAPPLPVIPAALHGKAIIALVLCWAGPVDEGETLVRRIRGFGTPAVDAVATRPYVAHQRMIDAAVPHGLHYYWKSHKLPPLTDDTIEAIVEHASAITSPFTGIPIFTQGGAVARVPADATAFAHRGAAHDINIVAAWQPDDPEPDRHVQWVRDFFGALEPHSQGVYVNFTSDDTADRVRDKAYGAEKWKRLVAVKNTYDPTNFFRLNANILPDGDGSMQR
ncbi:MAG: BBE domain-containing protein, partial [Sporichthyaceae bacterium]|nr:BBE domain-containing protein [Sporichthyaceae bacterium]